MRTIAIAFAAAITLGFAAPAMAAPEATSRAPLISVQADIVQAADELSAGKRKWKRHGWHGKRKWKHHRWHGHRGWRHRHHGWRHHARHCWRVWYHGRRVVVCR